MESEALTDVFSSRIREELELFISGENFRSYEILGCNKAEQEGYYFSVWAPNAKAVSLVGDFSDWEKGIPMRKLKDLGIWTVYSKKAQEGDNYKYKIKQKDGTVCLKIDPFSLEFEKRPREASRVKSLAEAQWTDSLWMARRKKNSIENRPFNIYEVHAGSWKRDGVDNFYSFKQLKEQLIPYVKEKGYTHIELMPIMEHPLDASWGYQLTGYFAVSSRYGTLEDFLSFVNECHQQNIGVLMDWVPGHFCRNDYGLAYYDGTPQFEYEEKNRANNQRWGALNFDISNPPVQSFLISSALFWLDYCHLDGIRVDAVSNMIYLDYDDGDWTPNQDGTNINYDGIHFLKKLNSVIQYYHSDVIVIAEESSACPKITESIQNDGLGFSYKWNMGWMNDTLNFFEMDPVYRKYHFELVTFSFIYMYHEKFILPLSHDEVVHGKKSLMHKMPGDRYNQFANLRTLYAYMISHPGKKLLFMGGEWGQFLEWREHEELEWQDLNDEMNEKMSFFSQYLNHIYTETRALWELDHSEEGMEVIAANKDGDSILSFVRKGKKKKDYVIVICNFVPHQHDSYEIVVPFEGQYEELLNTEKVEFGGTWVKDQGVLRSKKNKKGHDVLNVIVPSMSVLILKPKKIKYRNRTKK